MSESQPRSQLAVSLRFILLASALIFVLGYQQHQVHELRETVEELQQTSNDLREQLKTRNAVRVITMPTNRQQGRLRFPIEVERAMMGDSIRFGQPPAVTPLR